MAAEPTGRKGERLRIRQGWHSAGRTGTCLGPPLFVDQLWVPILWDDEEDPDWCKERGLEVVEA